MYAPLTKRLKLGSDTMALMITGHNKECLASLSEANGERVAAKATAVSRKNVETQRTVMKKRPAENQERYANAYDEKQSITSTYGGIAQYQGYGDKGIVSIS